MNEETTPNVTSGVDNNSNGKGAALPPERRKELADQIAETAKRAARTLASKLGKTGNT